MNALDRAPWLNDDTSDARWNWLIRPMLALGITLSLLMVLALIVGLGYDFFELVRSL